MKAEQTPPLGELILYQTADGRTRVECHFAEETLWLSQALMSELFQTTPQNVTQHLRAIYDAAELDPETTCKEFLQVRREGAGTRSPSWPRRPPSAGLTIGERPRLRLRSNCSEFP